MTLVARASLLLALVNWCVPASPDGQHAAVGIQRLTTLREPRAVHTATLLADGRILIAGGMSQEEAGASAELVDASSGRTEMTGPMAHARSGHTATALPDGRVLIVGGYDGGYLRSMEVYDPARGTFAPAGSLLVARSGHTATLLRSGRVLIAGGVGEGWTFLASAEEYDPATGRSVAVGTLASARESHTATLLADGRVLIVGGHQGRRAAMEVYASTELYDPTAARFATGPSLTTARHKHDAVRLADGRVLVIGGADGTDRRHFATTELFDPASGTIAPGPTMASTRYKLNGTSLLLPGGDVLVTGGARTAELLDGVTMTFRPVRGAYAAPIYFATATLVPNGDAIIAGGYGPSVESASAVWRYRSR